MYRSLQRSVLVASRRSRRELGGVRWHGGPKVPNDAPTITVTFLQPDKTRKEVQARVGESLLQTAHRNEIDLEGACEGGEWADDVYSKFPYGKIHSCLTFSLPGSLCLQYMSFNHATRSL